MLRTSLTTFVLALAAISFSGCHMVPGLTGMGTGTGGTQARRPDAPGVNVAEVRLTQMPDRQSLASYYCAEQIGPMICGLFLGAPPNESDIQFLFDLELQLSNRNPIPLPLVSALVGFTAFPGGPSDQNLGSVCMSFCEDPANCAQTADACSSDEPEIRTAQDFAMAAAGFLFSTALGQTNPQDLRVRTIPAGEEMRFIIRLGLEPRKMISMIKEATLNLRDTLRDRQIPEFTIPYQLEGSVWVNVENFGRFASGFGPYDNQWRLRDAVN